MIDKPLHVRVAEALGWTDCEPFEAWGIVDPQNWCGEAPGPVPEKNLSNHDFVPSYDTDWSATGPLIVRLGIVLFQTPLGYWWAAADGVLLLAGRAGDWPYERGVGVRGAVNAETPLIAVCNLILALHAAGKLAREAV